MNTGKALKIVSKYGPCPHFNLITDLGNGKIWARCEDCGETLQQENIQRYRNSSLEFDIAIETLNQRLEQVAEEIDNKIEKIQESKKVTQVTLNLRFDI